MSDKKTNAEYKTEEYVRAVVKDERETSDKNYAIKMVERIVFGLVAIILSSVAVALIALVVVNNRG